MTDDEPIHKVMRDLTEGNPDAPVLAGTGEIKLTEDQWDEKYGGAINESPLHLDADQLAAITEGYVWTQCEDGDDQDYLVNGAYSSNTADAGEGRLAFNVVGHWLSVKPWSSETHDAGDIHVTWGGGPDRYEDDPEDC